MAALSAHLGPAAQGLWCAGLRALRTGLAVLLLAGCLAEPPLRIGVLADLSGRNARFNIDGRNGVLLATEQINQAGGVRGRRIELLVRDAGGGDGRDFVAARQLLGAGVDLVIGPFSSSMADRLLPLFDDAGVLLLCPTSTDVVLAGRDDQLLRLNRTTRESARDHAQLLHGRGHVRLALATDMRNASNNGGWRDDFVQAFANLGGVVVADAEFGVAAEPTVHQVAQSLLAAGPDGLVFVANGVDAARLAQQVAKRQSRLPMAAPDWAEDSSLMEVGGHSVEGMLLASAHRHGDEEPRWRDFHRAFRERFGNEPNYRSIAAYDALTVAAAALARAQPGESARDALLRHGPYQGLQQMVAFDRYGDAKRAAYHTVVRGGRFEALP